MAEVEPKNPRDSADKCLVSHLSRHRAFSLVEVTIAVGVVGILSALAVPMFATSDIEKLQAAARLLAADIDHARIESIAHPEEPRILTIKGTNDSWILSKAPGEPVTASVVSAMETLTDAYTQSAYIRTLGQGDLRDCVGMTVQRNMFLPTIDSYITFGPWGGTYDGNDDHVILSLNGTQISVSIDGSTGEVTISDPY